MSGWPRRPAMGFPAWSSTRPPRERRPLSSSPKRWSSASASSEATPERVLAYFALPMNSNFDPSLLARIEEAGLNASAPPQQRLVDGWLLRFSPGKAKRARCLNAISAGLLPLDRKLALCQSVFDEVALPMLVRITPFSEPEGLDGALERRGMRRIDDTRVMVCAAPAAA